MRKTTVKLSWDVSQELGRLASHMSQEKGLKVDKDTAVRYLLEFYKKALKNGSKAQKEVSKK